MITREASTLYILYNGNVRKVAVCQDRRWIEEMSETEEDTMSKGYASDSSEMSGKEEDYTSDDVTKKQRREKMQRSKEMSSERRSSYLTELMKEGRMRCDEEGPTARVTRMDGRIRVQDNITPEKRKDNK